MHISIFCLSLCKISLWHRSQAIYATDTNTRQKYKIYALGKALIIDAVVKRESIEYMQAYYKSGDAYQAAQLVYEIRRKYTRMVFVFKRTIQYYETLQFEQFLKFMTEIQYLRAQIDALIHVFEEWAQKDEVMGRISRTGQALRAAQLQ
ncbi:hypothetical protein ACJJTC_000810 [Scirpophaga incertulas]